MSPQAENLAKDLLLSPSELAEKYSPAIATHSSRALRKCRGQFDAGDFSGACGIALMKAIKVWDRVRPLDALVDGWLRTACKRVVLEASGGMDAQRLAELRRANGVKAKKVMMPDRLASAYDSRNHSWGEVGAGNGVGGLHCLNPSPLEDLETSQTCTRLREVVTSLSTLQREVITRVFLREQDREEIARELGITLREIVVQTRYAMAHLRKNEELKALVAGG